MGYGSAQLGITPMIGQNDTAGEVFTLANAQSLRNNAAGASLLAFWSMGRDNGGCPGQTTASPTCAGVAQSTWQFSSILKSYESESRRSRGGAAAHPFAIRRGIRQGAAALSSDGLRQRQ